MVYLSTLNLIVPINQVKTEKGGGAKPYLPFLSYFSVLTVCIQLPNHTCD